MGQSPHPPGRGTRHVPDALPRRGPVRLSPATNSSAAKGDASKSATATKQNESASPWNGPPLPPGDFDSGDTANQAVTAAAQCMYGIAQTTVAALGCAPGLGFIHSGHELAFVLDIADLYKTEIAIPVAFRSRSRRAPTTSAHARAAPSATASTKSACCADASTTSNASCCPSTAAGDPTGDDTDHVTLQSDHGMKVESGRNYAEDLYW